MIVDVCADCLGWVGGCVFTPPDLMKGGSWFYALLSLLDRLPVVS